MAKLLGRRELDAAHLWAEHPPVIHHEKKQVILDQAMQPARGTLGVTRWAPSDIGTLGAPTSLESVLGPFSYPRPEAGVTSWHANFADTHLFAFYGIGAFAQDEIQVAEHPLLACVREWMLAKNDPALRPLTREPNLPTPVLVKGVPHWCAIDTTGMYGRALSRTDDDAVRMQVEKLVDAPLTNILSIVAPQGMGRYARDDIHDILVTATTGFEAARAESEGTRLRIHTGHWGTGAFGGNRVLMAAAQVLAARFTQVDELVYHSLSEDAEDAFRRGLAIADAVPAGQSLESVVDLLDERAFRWGSSDGN